MFSTASLFPSLSLTLLSLLPVLILSSCLNLTPCLCLAGSWVSVRVWVCACVPAWVRMFQCEMSVSFCCYYLRDRRQAFALQSQRSLTYPLYWTVSSLRTLSSTVLALYLMNAKKIPYLLLLESQSNWVFINVLGLCNFLYTRQSRSCHSVTN
jgi:hypothetical protein